MKKIKVAIFISDVGYGHMVRQREVIRQLLINFKNIDISVINHEYIEILKSSFGNKIKYRKRFNNITLFKDKNNFHDYKKSLEFIKRLPKHLPKTKKFIEKNFSDYSFFISDYVPEVFKIGEDLKIPSFGICHYTWSWYFNKNNNKDKAIIKLLKKYESSATKTYFPPFTASTIFRNYKNKNYKDVGLIIKKTKIIEKINVKKTFLLMDNGTKLLSKFITNIVPQISKNKNYNFYVGISSLNNKTKKIINESKNLKPVKGLKGIYSSINKVDHVIARGGFNTLTECLLFKKPSIFINERFNPEVKANIKIISKKKLGSTAQLENLDINFIKKLDKFLQKEKNTIKKNFSKLNLSYNGALEIVNDIKKELKLKNL